MVPVALIVGNMFVLYMVEISNLMLIGYPILISVALTSIVQVSFKYVAQLLPN